MCISLLPLDIRALLKPLGTLLQCCFEGFREGSLLWTYMHTEIDFGLLLNQPESDCIYKFSFDFEPNSIRFGSNQSENGKYNSRIFRRGTFGRGTVRRKNKS